MAESDEFPGGLLEPDAAAPSSDGGARSAAGGRDRPRPASRGVWGWCRAHPLVTGLLLGLVATLPFLMRTAIEFSRMQAIEKGRRLAVERQNDLLASGVRQAFEQEQLAIDAWKGLGSVVLAGAPGVPDDPALWERRMAAVSEGLRRSVEALEPLYRVYRDAVDAREADAAMALVDKRAGDTLQDLGLVRDALPYYQAMKTLTDALVAAHPDDPEVRELQAVNRLVLGRFYLNRVGDARVAQAYADEAVTLVRDRLARHSDEDGAKRGLADALALDATVALALGEPARAEPLSREEVKVRESLSEKTRDDLGARSALSAAHERLGEILLKQDQVEAAHQQLDASFTIREELAARSPNRGSGLRDIYRGIEQVGHAHMINRNDPASAREYYARAVAGFETLAAAEGGAEFRGDLASASYFLGTALLRMGDLPGSDAAYTRCLELRRSLAEDPRDLSAQFHLMSALARCGRVDQANAIIERLRAEAQQDPRAINEQVGCGLALCAAAVRRQKPDDPGAATPYVERAIAALTDAVAAGLRDRTTLLLNPDLDAIRQEPAFQQLLEQIARPQSTAAPRAPDA